jgi:hypothetical protein
VRSFASGVGSCISETDIEVLPAVGYKGERVENVMTTSNVHVTDGTQRVLQALSEETGKSISEILDKAVEEYRRKIFFEGVDRDYRALKADPQAWSQEVQERQLFENTLMDDLDPDERWTDDGPVKD